MWADSSVSRKFQQSANKWEKTHWRKEIESGEYNLRRSKERGREKERICANKINCQNLTEAQNIARFEPFARIKSFLCSLTMPRWMCFYCCTNVHMGTAQYNGTSFSSWQFGCMRSLNAPRFTKSMKRKQKCIGIDLTIHGIRRSGGARRNQENFVSE